MDKTPRSWKQFDECFQTFNGLIAVELVGRLNSRTRAAEHLGISVTALSSRLKTLAKRLNGPIIENPRSSALTPLGKALRKVWEASREDIEAFLGEIERLHNQRDLHLAVVRSVWEAEKEWLEYEYCKRMPGGEIYPFIEDGYEAITHQVRDGVVDIGVVSFLGKEEGVAPPVARRFWRSEEMVLVVNHARSGLMTKNAAVRPVDFKDLHQTFFTMPENTRMYNAVNGYLRKHGIHKFFRYKVPVEDVNAALREVMKGRGVSILPEPAVRQALIEQKIETFLLAPSLTRPLDLLYRENSFKKVPVQAFLECIDESKKRSRRLLSE
jgi:DNA-binding transcriptional LysR family regulator